MLNWAIMLIHCFSPPSLGRKFVVFCTFAVGKRAIKIGVLLSYLILPVLESILKLPYKNVIAKD